MSISNIKFTLLTAIMLTASGLHAQDSLKTRVELGLNMFNYTGLSIPTVTGGGTVFTPSIFNGVFFKLHFPEFAMRVGADHYTSMTKTIAHDFENDSLSSSNNYSNTVVSAGFERMPKKMRNKPFQFYYGGDLILSTGHFTSKNTAISGISEFTSEKFQTGVGLSPFIGLRVVVRKFFVISYEASFTGIYGQAKENRTYTHPAIEDTNTSQLTFDAKPNPVNRLSLSFMIPKLRPARKA